ncbi:MAG: hypothetical protein N2999_01240 [Proteobacteria bacterium]|nr:hypothetical protein [Pseudomonadota bacterium]
MKKLLFCFIFLVGVYGCASKIEPLVTKDVTLIKEEETLTSTLENKKVDVRISSPSPIFYGMTDSFIIFYLKIENLSDSEVAVNKEDFVLLDDKKNQSYALTTDEIAKIVEQNLFYLIPYPYVGYYSESLNYYEGRYLYNPQAPHVYPVSPREMYLEALPFEKILPKANIKGKIYFKKRLSEAKSLNLKVFKKDKDYIFDFYFNVK